MKTYDDLYNEFVRARNRRLKNAGLCILGCAGMLAAAKVTIAGWIPWWAALAPIWIPVAVILLLVAIAAASLVILALLGLSCAGLCAIFD